MLRRHELLIFQNNIMRGRVTRALKAAADILLPRKCIACGRILLLDEELLCIHCRADIPLTRFWTMKDNPMADRFNAILQQALEKQVTWTPEKYAYAAALFFYDSDGAYRHIPYQIKYHGNIQAGRFFGKMLGAHLSQSDWFKDVDTVIPVPLHWRRKWSRGYNQAEIIAREVASSLSANLRTDLLTRRRNTKTQTKLDISDKHKNVSGAFRTNKNAAETAHGIRHVLLIDDVFTTGSTALACFEALRAEFPVSVRISVATLGFVGGV